jgi:hypothetical protein
LGDYSINFIVLIEPVLQGCSRFMSKINLFAECSPLYIVVDSDGTPPVVSCAEITTLWRRMPGTVAEP